MNANEKQVGGQHYREGGVTFQHWDVVVDYGVDYLAAVATKYVTRWRKKGGLEDLRKSEHYVEKLLEKWELSPGCFFPTRKVPDDVVEEFVRQYHLEPMESEIIWLLFRWETSTDIKGALTLIRDLIAREEKIDGTQSQK